MQACINGESAALRELYETLAPRLLFTSRRYVGSVVAEDILHDAFISIISSLGQFRYRGEGSLRAWSERIVINTAIKYLRKEGRISTYQIDESFNNLVDEPTQEQTTAVPMATLTRFIEELPDGYRAVFNLFCVEKYSHKEIAQMLGIKERTSSSQLHKAKTHLANKINEYLKSQRR